MGITWKIGNFKLRGIQQKPSDYLTRYTKLKGTQSATELDLASKYAQKSAADFLNFIHGICLT